jgi:signal transduction histidine kinase
MKLPQLSIRTTLLVIIGTLDILIAILAGSSVYHSWTRFNNARTLMQGSVNINLLYRANRFLSLERAASLSVLYVEPDTAESLHVDLSLDRKEANEALTRALAQIKIQSLAQDVSSLVGTVEEKFGAVQTLRQALDENLAKPPPERDPGLPDRVFAGETELELAVRDLILAYDRPLRAVDAVAAQQMMFKFLVWEITEYAGREYAVIGRLIAENKPATPAVQEDLMLWRNLAQHGWETAGQFMAGGGLDRELKPYMDEAETHYFLTFDQLKEIFYESENISPENPYPLTIEMWLELASQAVDSLLALKDQSLKETQLYVDLMERKARRQIALNLLLFVCAGMISLYCLAVIILRVIRPVNAMVDALYDAAQGKSHGPLPAVNRQDEIGKLASVLEAFQENARRIKQSNEELERYAYITAHDLKSPLRAIDNLSQWIQEDLGPALTGDAKVHMDTLRSRVRRMEKLLNDTLEYSRIDNRIQSVNKELIDAWNLVQDAVALAAPPKGFTIKIDKKFEGIKVERLPLQQVFYNLINNAIKHHDRENGIIEIEVDIGQKTYDFSVKDDGPGIPKEYHEKVFEMFQTLKPRDQKEGSGMGLAFVKKILAACGAGITLESEPGHGSVFRFTWPKLNEEEQKNV